MFDAIKKLLDLLNERDRRQGLILLLSMLLVAAFETAGIASIMPFMAVVTDPSVIHSNKWLSTLYNYLGFSGDRDFLRFLGVSVVVLLVVSNLIKAANSWLTQRYHNKLNYVLAQRLLAKYMSQPYAFFLNRNTAELAKNILTEARNVVTGIVSPATDLVSRGLVALAIIGLLLVVDPTVAIAIASGLGGLYAIIYVTARRKLNAIGRLQVDANAKKYKAADEALSGIKELKVLGREPYFLRQFATHSKRHAKSNATAGLIGDMPRFALEVIAFGGILGVVIYLLGRSESRGSLVPLLALYAFAGYRLLPALQQLFASAALLRRSVAALDVLHADLVSPVPDILSPERRLIENSCAPPLPFTDSLELRDLWFRYDGAPEPAIRGVSLRIGANNSIGIVGPTGCGKTTLVDIVLGLLHPSAGELRVDGRPITTDLLARWQRSIGYVPQQIYISDDTMARNIAFGVPESEIDMDAVRRAARIARLDEFIESELAAGYDTGIGERGIRLSGGQRQRIGIARALYRDPALLVMDEATSALDGITEESVMDAVRTLSRRKTVILIAHRLTTVRECDVIYLMERGRIAISGSYDELRRKSEWFRAAAGN
jgi:ABC-type multidrug transport system fused ATPase/permease subunit